MNLLPTSLSEHTKGVLSLVLLAWVFGTMGIFVRHLDESFALFEQSYLRIGLAFLIGALLFSRHIKWSKLLTLPIKDWVVLIFRALMLYTGVVLFTESILTTTYANASFVAALPFLPVLGYIFLREKLRWLTVFFIFLGFIGVSLIAVDDFSALTFGHGELMAFLSMFAFDFSYIARRWHSDHLDNRESSVFMFFFGALFLFAASLSLGEPLPTADKFAPFIIVSLVLSALFNILNLYLTNYGFARVKVGVAGNILTLETVVALCYSLFLYGEVPILREVIGGALVLLSVYLVNRQPDEIAAT